MAKPQKPKKQQKTAPPSRSHGNIEYTRELPPRKFPLTLHMSVGSRVEDHPEYPAIHNLMVLAWIDLKTGKYVAPPKVGKKGVENLPIGSYTGTDPGMLVRHAISFLRAEGFKTIQQMKANREHVSIKEYRDSDKFSFVSATFRVFTNAMLAISDVSFRRQLAAFSATTLRPDQLPYAATVIVRNEAGEEKTELVCGALPDGANVLLGKPCMGGGPCRLTKNKQCALLTHAPGGVRDADKPPGAGTIVDATVAPPAAEPEGQGKKAAKKGKKVKKVKKASSPPSPVVIDFVLPD